MANEAEKALALLDIDNSLYEGYLVFPLVKEMEALGLAAKGTDANIGNAARSYKRGSIDYEQFAAKLLIDWASGLKGVDHNDAFDLTEEFIRETADRQFFPHTRPLIETLQRTHDIYLVTGEPDFVGEAVRQHFMVIDHISSEFALDKENKFTGQVTRPLAHRNEKLDALAPVLSRYPKEKSFGLGDSDGDIELLASVQHPFCINAKDSLKVIAAQNNWSVVNNSGELVELVQKIYS